MWHKNTREDTNFNSIICGHYHRCCNIAPGASMYQMLPTQYLLNMLRILGRLGLKYMWYY